MNNSSGLPDRPTALSNGPSFRRPNSRPVSVNSMDAQPYIPVVTVIVMKDENGYGMKVSGDNPVYVQSVKEGGAAERAGLHSGDKIIKVNGVNVTQSTHTEVVALIKSSTQVVLTVQQRPPSLVTRPMSTSMTSPSLQHSRPLHNVHHPHHSVSGRMTDRITSPLPVDHEKQRQMLCERVNTIRLMLEKEQRYVDSLRSDLVRCNDPKLIQDLAGAERRVRTLQEQLLNITSSHPEPEAVNPHVSHLHSHHRTKSSPDNMQNIAEMTRRLIASESMSDLSCNMPNKMKIFGGSSWDVDSPRITPPGTPPPPYGINSSNNVEATDTHQDCDEGNIHEESPVFAETSSPDISPLRHSTVQQPIILMEDDEMSDQEVTQSEEHGPFKSLSKLWGHNAHLAVFMNYVISNRDPSSLLFYLITDLYKEGNAKEMKKWAYEIHSSFLVPCAPLRLNNVDENVAREIDDILLKEVDREEILRKIFFRARTKAKEELNELLADFQQKRTTGLGTIFGPPDAQLDESIHDKNKEMKIVESILVPKIEPYLNDIEQEIVDPRRFTTAAALCTVMSKIFGLRGPHSNPLLDRCPTFVSKDKSLKAKLIGKSRKVTVRGHHFVAHQYYTVTYCNHCQNIISGIGPQGYQCSDCTLNIHRHCVKILEENCPGPMTKKEKGNDRISKLMEKIRPEREPRRKPSSLNFSQVDRMKRQSEEDPGSLTDGESGTGDRPVSGGRSGERRPDPVRESEERTHNDTFNNEDDYRAEIRHVPKKPSATSINRSESYKERVQKRQLRERRKTSDPNLSKSTDVDVDNNQSLSYNSGSSSNSSLSTRSLDIDSPSNSLETVSSVKTHEAVTVTLTPNSSGALYDSDIEAEPDPPHWALGVDELVIKQLSEQEKKRQDIVHELFHSERSHVRMLKVLDQIFYRPLVESQLLPSEHIRLLFSNLDQMLDIHSQFNNRMKEKQQDNPIVGDIGDLLLSMFDGPAGEEFQRAASTFCAKQQIALELLKERRRKDPKLNSFLCDLESSPYCRRLQLKDIIPTGMQRLTKYPLLFENLARHTFEGTEEYSKIQRSLERSREILNNVNQAKREVEDQQRLTDIQKRLDKSGFEKVDNPMAGEFKTLDLTKHRLIYEGPLMLRVINRSKLVDLHVLLLNDIIVLLQKQDEKYLLKFYNTSTATGGIDKMPTSSPIIKISTVHIRKNASNKKALFLVNTSEECVCQYELSATSSSEMEIWFRHISEAAEAYKTREGKNRKPDHSVSVTAADDAGESLHNKKDSEEASPDVPRDSAAPLSERLTPSIGDTEQGSPSPSEGTPPPPPPPPPQTSPSSNAKEGGDSVTNKIGDGHLSPSQRRRGDVIHLTTEESSLVQPSEVVIVQQPVLVAEPVLTPIEKLRRKDEEIRLALSEKQHLVADILHVPREEFENIAELAGEPSADKEAAELVLAAVNNVNQLTSMINEVLIVSEEDAVTVTSEGSNNICHKVSHLPAVPAHRLQNISVALNKHLTQLLRIVKERDEERERFRKELQISREQLHIMHENQRKIELIAPTSPSQSRPNSYLSSSQDESAEHEHESEDDTGLNRLAFDEELVKTEEKHAASQTQDDHSADVFVDALSEETENHLESELEAPPGVNDRLEIEIVKDCPEEN